MGIMQLNLEIQNLSKKLLKILKLSKSPSTQ